MALENAEFPDAIPDFTGMTGDPTDRQNNPSMRELLIKLQDEVTAIATALGVNLENVTPNEGIGASIELRRITSISLPNGITPISLDTLVNSLSPKDATYFEHGVRNGIFGVQVKEPGTYLVHGHISFSADSSGHRIALIQQDGTTISAVVHQPYPTSVARIEIAKVVHLGSPAYLGLSAQHNVTGGLTLDTLSYSPKFTVTRLGS